jgi:hypothetical protein
LISLVAATVVSGGWYLYQNAGERLTMRVPEVPERLANPPGVSGSGPGETPADTPTVGAAVPAAPPPPTSSTVSPTGGGSPAATTSSPVSVAGAPRPASSAVEPALPPPPGDPTRRLAAVAPAVPPAAPPAPPASSATPPSAATPAPAGTTPPGVGSEPEDSPPPDPTSLSAAPAGGAAAIPPVPQVAAAPDGRVFGAQNGDSRVVIKARGESWVQVRDAANTPLLTRVLRPGDTYRVPNQAGLTMMTGNAGVLDVFVDGNAAPSLGAVGAVRRNIALDADRLRNGTQ